MIKNPKGTLIPVGGAEVKHEEEVPDNNPAKFYELGILKCILNEIPEGEEPHIEIITTATADPDEVFENYRSGFEKAPLPLHRPLQHPQPRRGRR